MKTIASNVAPNPKEAQFWIDLSADPHGGITKYRKGNKWVPINESNSNAEFNKNVLEVLNMLTDKVKTLENQLKAMYKEFETLYNNCDTLNNKVKKLEQFIVTE